MLVEHVCSLRARPRARPPRRRLAVFYAALLATHCKFMEKRWPSLGPRPLEVGPGALPSAALYWSKLQYLIHYYEQKTAVKFMVIVCPSVEGSHMLHCITLGIWLLGEV